MYVKICGIPSEEMALHAIRSGASAIGVVMSPGSPRDLDPGTARAIVEAAHTERPSVDTVLVVRHMPIAQAVRTADELGFDVLQLHGAYSPDEVRAAGEGFPRIWRAVSLVTHPGASADDAPAERLLVDGAQPGSGATWDLRRIDPDRLGPGWLLAGGLSPDNVADAISAVHPWGVDVSSGVESAPGVKDPELVSRFIAAATQE